MSDALFGPEMLSEPPPLEKARRALESLRMQVADLLAPYEGDDNPLPKDVDSQWKRLRRTIAEAEQTVSELERKEIR